MAITNREEFEACINSIMQKALNMNVISAEVYSLQSLVIEPENHTERLFVTSVNIIDNRKQKRDLQKLVTGEDYKDLIEEISTLKKDSEWTNYLEWIQIRRQSREPLQVYIAASSD